MAVTFDDAVSARRVVQGVRSRHADTSVLVTMADDAAFRELKTAGASVILAEDVEASLMFGTELLVACGMAHETAARSVNQVRFQLYPKPESP